MGAHPRMSHKLGGTDGGLLFNKPPKQFILYRPSILRQEFNWYRQCFWRFGKACRYGLLGGVATGAGFYVLHQTIWRGSGENLSAVEGISTLLGRPAAVASSEAVPQRDLLLEAN